jgi:hypothetical protein
MGETSRISIGSRSIAAQPVLKVDGDAMKPTTPTTQLVKPILIPEATITGPADVPTGFPHTLGMRSGSSPH